MKQSSQSEIIPQNVLAEIYGDIPGEALTRLRAARERCAEQRIQRLLKGDSSSRRLNCQRGELPYYDQCQASCPPAFG